MSQPHQHTLAHPDFLIRATLPNDDDHDHNHDDEDDEDDVRLTRSQSRASAEREVQVHDDGPSTPSHPKVDNASVAAGTPNVRTPALSHATISHLSTPF